MDKIPNIEKIFDIYMRKYIGPPSPVLRLNTELPPSRNQIINKYMKNVKKYPSFTEEEHLKSLNETLERFEYDTIDLKFFRLYLKLF